jgi:hypothetical protein
MSKKDRDAIVQEPELSKAKKAAIAYIAKAGWIARNPLDPGANGHMDPSESSIRESVNAEIQSLKKGQANGHEFDDHPPLAESLTQIIVRHPDAKGLEAEVAKLITGAKVVYRDDNYETKTLTVTPESAETIAAEQLERIRQGNVHMNKKGEIETEDRGKPSLYSLIESAVDADIAAHLVPAQRTPAASNEIPKVVAKSTG